MKYKIELSETAKQSILDIFNFLALVNKKAALEDKNEIFDSIHSLEEFPYRHGLLDIDSKYYKFVISKGKYAIIYSVLEEDEKVVFIYDILDSRKDNKIINDLK